MSQFLQPIAARGPVRDPELCAPVAAALQVGMCLCAMPFDAVRVLHAAAVQAGLARRSMLASRDFEQALGAIERLMLGPLARSA